MLAKFKTQDERNRAFQNVYRTKDGRMVLDHIMQSICNIETEVLKPTDSPTQAFYWGGIQSVGLRIKKILNAKLEEKGD
jgi:hypothetical protein